MAQLSPRPPDLDAQGRPLPDTSAAQAPPVVRGSRPPDLDANGQPVASNQVERTPDFRVSVSAREQMDSDPLGYVGDLFSHVPSSTYNAIVETARAVPNVVELLSELTPRGATSRLTDRIFGQGAAPVEPSRLLQAIRSLPGALADRYLTRFGTAEARAQTMRDDPVGFVADVAAVAAMAKSAATLASRGRSAISGRTPFANPNQAERSAVEFGENHGIPISAATATGNRFVRGTQRMVDESLGGSVVADKARQAEAAALTATGDRLAARVHSTSVAPEQAGQSVRDALAADISANHARANRFYAKVREAEDAVGGIPVDVSAAQHDLRPIYEALKRESDLAPLQGGKARALVALDRLMQPQQASAGLMRLSDVEAALGDLKTLGRGAAMPALRSGGQAVAARAVAALEKQVQNAAVKAGHDVYGHLMAGRAATKAKYSTAGVLKALREEPVQVFQQATWAKDAGIDRLRQVANIAPGEMAKIGRAYLDDLLGKATSQGGFSGADGLFGKWQQLGPETKTLLFGKGMTRDLDDFFLLAKKMAENPNPSGTALTVFKGGEIGSWYITPAAGVTYSVAAPTMAKLLRYPPFVRLLSRGLRATPSQRAVGGAELAAMARAAGVELRPVATPGAFPSPALAGDEEQ